MRLQPIVKCKNDKERGSLEERRRDSNRERAAGVDVPLHGNGAIASHVIHNAYEHLGLCRWRGALRQRMLLGCPSRGLRTLWHLLG